MTPLNENVPIVEGDPVTLTCRSKNKDEMQLAWRWLPHGDDVDWFQINQSQLPAGSHKFLTPVSTINLNVS